MPEATKSALKTGRPSCYAQGCIIGTCFYEGDNLYLLGNYLKKIGLLKKGFYRTILSSYINEGELIPLLGPNYINTEKDIISFSYEKAPNSIKFIKGLSCIK